MTSKDGNQIALGLYAKARNYFEDDALFPPECARTVNAYERASRNAALSAKRAIYQPAEERERSAWLEAVAATLERVLSASLSDEPVELPGTPGDN